MRPFSFWLALLVIVTLPPASQAQKKWACLVRVSQYNPQSGDIPAIGKAGEKQNDVTLMREALEERGFTCVPLEDRDATHERIMTELNRYAEQVGPKDAIVFYFSGHGANSRAGAFSLCPYDATKESDANDIHESDLQEWLNHVHTRNVTLILDCCFTKYHEAVKSRGFNLKPKFIGRDDLPVEGDSGLHHIDPTRAIVMTAASDTGEAYQVQSPLDKSWVGLFTYNLCNSLKQSKAMPELGYAQLIDDVKKKVLTFVNNQNAQRAQQLAMQKPMLYGAKELQERKLFSSIDDDPVAPSPALDPSSQPKPEPKPVPIPEASKTQYVRPYVPVSRVEGSKVFLGQGSEAGIANNAEYRLFPPKATQFVGKPLAVVKVTTARAKEAEAVAIDGTDLSKLPKDVRATLGRLPGGEQAAEPLTIKLTGTADLVKELQVCLKKYPFMKTITEGDAPVQCRIDVQKAEDGGNGVMGKWLFAEGNDTITDKPFQAGSVAELADQLAPYISRTEILLHFVHLENPNPMYKVQLTTDKSVYNEDDKPVFTVQSDKDCYLFVIGLDPAGLPNLLYPTSRNENNLLTANTPRRVPNTHNDITVTGILGREMLVALTITNKGKADELKQRLFAAIASQSPITTRSLVTHAIADVQTSDLDEWNIQTQDYQTQPKR